MKATLPMVRSLTRHFPYVDAWASPPEDETADKKKAPKAADDDGVLRVPEPRQ